MPSSLRLGALLFASVSADQISLMQDVKKSSKRDGKHMSALMESAKGMLKNGATPDVVSFAEETLADIQSVVIPAIKDESKIQQEAVLHKWQQMRELIDVDLPRWKQTIARWSAEVAEESIAHRNCRDVEHCLCYGDNVPETQSSEICPGQCPEDHDCKRPCEQELYRLWGLWVGEETELREFHGEISGHFCPTDANGTTATFRQTSKTWMQSYMDQKVIVDAAETAYDNFRPTCIEDHNNLNAQSTQCNALQLSLESKACSEARAVQQTLSDFHQRYADLQEERIEAWNNARTDELMRHREYRQIKIVECLLNRIHELNGRPCDDASGEVDTEMSNCQAEGEALRICDVDPLTTSVATLRAAGARYETRDENVHIDSIMTGAVTNGVYEIHGEDGLMVSEGWSFGHSDTAGLTSQGSICIVYPEDIPVPPSCPGDEPCLPVPPPHPCDAVWRQEQITLLPVMPQPDFSATNPGCNQYPSCSACDLED